MFGWLSQPAMRDSRRKRSAKAGSRALKPLELLERDEPLQVALAGEVHDGHAAAAQLADDVVFVVPRSDSIPHAGARTIGPNSGHGPRDDGVRYASALV